MIQLSRLDGKFDLVQKNQTVSCEVIYACDRCLCQSSIVIPLDDTQTN
jgi:hypothetical protein